MNNQIFTNLFESFSDKQMSRETAYLVSKYGRRITEQEMLKTFLRTVKQLIRERAAENEYSLVIEVPEPLVKYKQSFETLYNTTLEYGIAFINGNQIKDFKLSKGVFNTKKTYMFLSWGKDIFDEKKISDTELSHILNESMK